MTEPDIKQLAEKGISPAQFEEQLACFRNGFPFLHVEKAATIGDGIVCITDTEKKMYFSVWNHYLSENKKVVKFVPASGAASRMFKDLFEFLESDRIEPKTAFERMFFGQLSHFAFFDDLNKACLKNNAQGIEGLLAAKEYKAIIKNLLDSHGLNYGALPKGLLKFHHYKKNENRTPTEEHLVEGALYANAGNEVALHFTVSAEHRTLFEKHLSEVLEKYSLLYKVNYSVSISEQKKSTDTVATDANNEPFREKGKLLFRPGGHGALIANLNDLDADVVFIKNIDNVVPDRLKTPTVEYKKLIAGVLVDLQQKVFAYMALLETGDLSDEKISEIGKFSQNSLYNQNSNFQNLNREEKINYLIGKLNRPIRVCGMVKNEGEPGGGPYLVRNADGTVSPQILESSQIDTNDPRTKAIMDTAGYFNPVDLVCGLKNYKGEKFDLTCYVDKNTGFISSKSKNGKELKALELPGLWNGAMSDWNSIFVEVPATTFNPVTTVNDLLRKEHQ
jgi:hypothetical protein